jgi:cysteine-rich repeat protein
MRSIRVLVGLWVAALMGSAGTAWGHGGQLPDLAFYGDFGKSTTACQRMMGLATRSCFERVLSAQRACMEAQMGGGTCDEVTRDAIIDAAKQTARERVARYCSSIDLGILQFLDLDDAQTDVVNSCNAEAEAAISLVYGPVIGGGGVSLPSERETCLRSAAYESTKIMRYAFRQRALGLDGIAARPLSLGDKEARMTRASQRISRSRQRAMRSIEARCGTEQFTDLYGKSVGDFLDLLEARANCLISAGYVQGSVTCPLPVCGNAVKEVGEECDDGNTIADDVCHNDCTKADCSFFPTTYDLIQAAIFESKGCTSDLCHGNALSGGLDLRRGVSYSNLIDVPSLASTLARVEPGDKDRSFLWRKLAAATLGNIPDLEGSPMPSGGLPALNQNELEALRVWIYSGAPSTGVVAGVAGLLDACSPPPDPLQIRAPAPPASGAGVQMHMPQLPLPSQSETEVCFASYYDFTDQVPPQFRGSNNTFRFKSRVETQDPMSHHLIIHAYLGQHGVDHAAWGAWTCKGGSQPGQPCDPLDLDSCGSEGVCGSEPRKTVACIGFGPPDYNAVTAPAFGGSQEPVASTRWPDGVYSELPLKGIVVWNSHAFNLTGTAGKVEAWVNFDFAPPAEQRFPVLGGILDPDNKIFIMNVPPFERRRYCHQYIFPQGARLFEITSHMHQRGKLFQIYAPNGTPEGQLVYTSTQYNDPIQMTLEQPLPLDSPNPEDRTYRYCAEYDNGFTNPAQVKRKSTSPPPPLPFPGIGGPCQTATHCTEGRTPQRCSGTSQAARDRSCDTSEGAGDGRCDACPLLGGVTTEDEMFLFIAYYYCDPAYATCLSQQNF